MRTSPAYGVRGPATGGRAVVLLLHGGRVTDTKPDRRGVAWARMLPFAAALGRATRGTGTAIWLLRYRVRGWNGPAADPVVDTRWALAEAQRCHPGAPVVLVGHSMGGRVALRLAGEPGVAGVCALAPWIEPEDEVRTGASLLLAHGTRDRVTDPAASAAYATRAGARFVRVPGDGHAMLRRPLVWNRLVDGFVTGVIDSA